MPTLYWTGTRAELDKQLAKIGPIISGRMFDQKGLGREVANVIAVSFLSSTTADFVVKMRGGTGEVGGRWEKLKPESIARRKVGPEARKQINIAEREALEKQIYNDTYKRLIHNMGESQARARARQIASAKATRALGQTKAQLLGSRQVEILRDTGHLLNSLSPGILRNGIYIKPTKPGGDQQDFVVVPGKAIVGSGLIYAGTHQRGQKLNNVPARPFFPNDEFKTPESWWRRMRLDIARALPGALGRFLS